MARNMYPDIVITAAHMFLQVMDTLNAVIISPATSGESNV